MHTQLVTSPLPAMNGAFTVSFAEGADGGPETLLFHMRDFQFRIWHRWNGSVVNTMVVITECCDGIVYGRRQNFEQWRDGKGYDAGPWQCAVADLIHVEYQ